MRRYIIALLAAFTLLIHAAPVRGQASTLKINDAALNSLAGRIEPLELNGRYAFNVSVWTPFGPAVVTICDSNWTARVTQLRFATTPQQITVTGTVSATWCNASFSANLNTTGNAVYRASDRSIVTTINPTNIQPIINVLGFQVALPVHINVSPSLAVPAIPVQGGQVVFQTVSGTKTLTLIPTGVTLTKRAGYLELQANVNIW